MAERSSKTNGERLRAWKLANPDKVKTGNRKYSKEHPEVGRRSARKYRENHLEEIRAKQNEVRHNRWINDPEWKQKVTARNNQRRSKKLEIVAGRPRPDGCEICGLQTESKLHRRLVFDHCHSTGKFRGWLCDRCNKVLGLLYDDESLLLKMRDYLVRGGYGEIDSRNEERSA